MIAKGGTGREGLGMWDEQMQTIAYGMGKPQGPTIQHMELNLITCDRQ